MTVCGWAQKAGQEGCEESRPTPVLNPRTFKTGTSCYSYYGIKDPIDVDTGAVFIVDAFSIGDIYLSLRIINALFLSCFSTQHRISPTIYFSPVPVHNTLYYPRSISLIFQYTTLYITHVILLSCFSTKHRISHTLYFSPISVHNTVYHPRSILLLFQYTKMYITHEFYLPSFSIQHSI